MLNKEQIRNIRIFMRKAQLVGDEVPAYVNVWNALDAADKALDGPANVPTANQPGPTETP